MNRSDFQQLTSLRLDEAKALLAAGFPDGAYYLAGYAVECAFKACIAKRTKLYDFPDKTLVLESHTHSLKELFRLAQVKDDWDTDVVSNPALKRNWNLLLAWSETSRYDRGKTRQQAFDLLNAIEDPQGGILPWVHQRW